MLVECRLQGASHVITHLCEIFNIRAKYRAKEYIYNFAALACQGGDNFWNIQTQDDNLSRRCKWTDAHVNADYSIKHV